MSKPILTVSHLTKRFLGGTADAVHDVHFSVHPGEVLGIIGPNGAGKSTTVKLILGLVEPTEGSVQLFGTDVRDQRVRQRIGYMPESTAFYPTLTGRELLTMVGRLFGMSKQAITERSAELLAKVDLTEAADRQLGGYSKGMLQRINFAQALINTPDLIFLDEPLDGLDPLGRIAMRELLLKEKERGAAIVFNSHILSDVSLISDRIAILHKGALLKLESTASLVPKDRSLEDVFISPIHAA